MRYAAHLTRHESGWVTVCVPDVPDVVAVGRSETDALARAQRVVLIRVHQLMADQQTVPLPASRGDVWIEIPPDEAAAIE